MRSVPKRKIVKAMKQHALPLMDIYFNNEESLAVMGVSVVHEERVWAISDTLSHYAHILYRYFGDQSEIYKEQWAKLLLDFY